MATAEAATATQLRNIEQSTGRTVAQWSAVITEAGPRKHGEIVAYLKGTHGLTHGNANLLALKVREFTAGGAASDGALIDAQYTGGKEALRPVYEAVASAARALGSDVTLVVQKTGVSLRRGKQFGLIQAPSAKRVELGLNLGDTTPTGRLQSATGMCTHRMVLTALSDVDRELLAYLQAAYDRAR